MCIGNFNGLDVFNVFVDRKYLDPDTKREPAGRTYTGHTQMNARHQRILVTYYLWQLSRLHIGGVYCAEDKLFSISLDPKVTPTWNHTLNFKFVLGLAFVHIYVTRSDRNDL